MSWVSQLATPRGFARSRSAYSTISRSLTFHSSKPIVGSSSGCRMRSSTAERYRFIWPTNAGLNGTRPKFDHDEPPELEVVEEQVHAKVAVADFEQHLPADEGETGAHLQQEALDVVHQALFRFPLRAGVDRAEEVEQVGILERLRREVRLRRRQRSVEVGDGVRPFVRLVSNLEGEGAPAPA